jgi:hypothetical protein
MRYHLTPKSANAKTGPIPVSTTSAATCPDNCGFKRGADGVNGCYADGGPLGMHWKAVTEGKRGTDWQGFLSAVRGIEAGALWRHNQAGDLPGLNDALDAGALAELVAANAGRKGFTYTHKPMATPEAREAVRAANAGGFTVNLSADTLAQADALAAHGIGPVVVVLPSDATQGTLTPEGRKVVVCPATQRDDVTCATCTACANSRRSVIIGFPAHGASAKRATAVAQGRKVIAIRAA